jgi:hypothetical protein
MSKIRLFIIVLAVFSLGWLLNTALTNFVYYDVEKPLNIGFATFSSSPELLSPSDHVKESQIHVYEDRIIIETEGASWAAFTDSNSMDPFLDETSNSIEIKPEDPDDIDPGDIISYRSGITGDLIVHRVISKGEDESGVYYIVKGDNNPAQDPEKIRFEQINGVLIGIIY